MYRSRGIFVADIETLKSCFTYVGFDVDTKKTLKFVLHKDRFDFAKLWTHLKKDCKALITFNGIEFDYPVLHHFLVNHDRYIIENSSSEDIINDLYNKAQYIIGTQNVEPKVYHSIKDKDCFFKIVDLFKIWHYNNRARSTSLKALQIGMNYPNVMDMPIHHSTEDITLEQVEEILKYNTNDTLSTYEFYKKTVEFGKLDLRKEIKSKYGLPCTNWNNGKIGEQLILKLYCDELKLDPWEVRKLRTYRDSINLAECIPNNITFKSKEFNSLLDFYRSKVITNTKGEAEFSVIYKGHKYDMGSGGEHGFHKSGVYESNDKYIIKSCDVASLHPNLPLVYGFYPEHLGKEFLKVYGDNIVKVRLAEKAKSKKDQNKAIIDGYKEAANVPYGKSNEQTSFLYDPLYTMKTTVASQLVLCMLCEELANIPNSQMLMSNTDGAEIIIPREFEGLYYQICKNWQEKTKLVLEFADYQKIWARDINNYGCLTTDGKIKNKGALEVDKVIGNEPAYHKDNSFKIIPLAIQEYFVRKTPIEKTIKEHKNIYDFCGRQKFKGKDYGKTRTIKDNRIFEEKQQKNVRYFISHNGKSFIKCYAKGSFEIIHKDYNITIFNEFIEKPMEDYNINYNYYIKECYKILNVIENKQLELF